MTEQLALLAATQTATLNNANTPDLARSVWLGGAGLSVCGIFIIQYFSIKAFSITDEDMKALVQDGNQYINSALLANAVTSPVVIVLWASILFMIGVVDYVVKTTFHGPSYKIFAAIPIAFGLGSAVLTFVIGQILGERVESRVR
jgi:hypothetical protein